VYFQFPAWVEICRQKKGVVVPSDLATAYADALARLPLLIAKASQRQWDEYLLASALAALAAAKGFGAVAEAAMELRTTVASDFMEWFHAQ
jgi:hypothetical protein